MIQKLLYKFTIHFLKWGKYKPNESFTTFCISLSFTFKSEGNISRINDSQPFPLILKTEENASQIKHSQPFP